MNLPMPEEGFDPGRDPEDDIPWDADRNLPFDDDRTGDDNE
jgi:hypothetical protein